MLARGHGEVRKPCKGANAASPRAKVQKWETKLRVAGGSPGWLVAGGNPNEIPHPRVVYYRYGSTLTGGWVGYSSSDAAAIDRSSQ